MSETELRIGNYYNWEAEGKDYLYKIEPKDFANDNYKNFKPIPLTEEWLLKFGFENEIHEEVENRLWYYKSSGFYLHQEYWGDKAHDGFSFATRTREDGISFKAGYNINTVHQLQNLYHALTGKELKT